MSLDPSDNSKLTSVNKSGYSATNGGEVTYTESSETKGMTEVVMMQSTEISQGPLPPPRILKEYDGIIKNGAERIMAMAEKEQEVRLQERKLNGESNRRLLERKLDYFKRGQWMALFLAVVMLGVTILFAFCGFETLSIITLSSTLVGVTALFVYSSNQQKKE